MSLMKKMIEKLIKATDANNEAFKALYEAAFPPEEQIPWENSPFTLGQYAKTKRRITIEIQLINSQQLSLN